MLQVPLFTFPTVEAPRFAKGYPASVVFVCALWASVMFGHWYMGRHEARQLETGTAREEGERSESDLTRTVSGEGASEKGEIGTPKTADDTLPVPVALRV